MRERDSPSAWAVVGPGPSEPGAWEGMEAELEGFADCNVGVPRVGGLSWAGGERGLGIGSDWG